MNIEKKVRNIYREQVDIHSKAKKASEVLTKKREAQNSIIKNYINSDTELKKYFGLLLIGNLKKTGFEEELTSIIEEESDFLASTAITILADINKNEENYNFLLDYINSDKLRRSIIYGLSIINLDKTKELLLEEFNQDKTIIKPIITYFLDNNDRKNLEKLEKIISNNKIFKKYYQESEELLN